VIPRVLIAGIGNVFLGDDGFGVEVVRRLSERVLPPGVRAVDFGIRGLDLGYSLLDAWEGAILVDAIAREGPPGTLFVIEPTGHGDTEVAVETHGMHPGKVLAFARSLGGSVATVRIVGCVPLHFGSEEEPALGLSAPVAASVDRAAALVLALVSEIQDGARAREV
jgi:hydrogenase maturation protease